MAITIPASRFSLRFSEAVNIGGHFGPGQLANAKGLAYHSGIDRILITVTPAHTAPGGRTLILQAVDADGTRTHFAPGYSPFRDVESMVVVVPPSGPPIRAGFSAGDVYVNRGPNGQISRINAGGSVVADVWVDLHSAGLWGGLAFDQVGTFGGQMVAADIDGKIFLVGSGGQVTRLVDLGMRLEGISVAPTSFGPLGGQIIVGVEGQDNDDPNSGKVYAVDMRGTTTMLTDIGFCAENIAFVPSNGGTFYQAQTSFECQRDNKLLTASASQFLARAGYMMVTNEMSGDLWEVAWDGTRYTQSLAGRAPGRWTSEGLYIGVQRTELEHADFAVRAPSIPVWTDWTRVPGDATTDARPSACLDQTGNLHLFVKGIDSRLIYMKSLASQGRHWSEWTAVPPAGQTTRYAISSILFNTSVYLFTVRDDGHTLHKRLFTPNSPTTPTNESWQEVPGGFATDAPVSAAVATGRLVLCAKGTDGQIYINELACGGRSWGGWSLVPGDGHTNTSPTVVNFQDELYLLIKGITSNQILTTVRSADGASWSQWAQLPGAGRTNASVMAVSANRQCYVVAKDLNNVPIINIASNTGTWSTWGAIPNPGSTDTALAMAAVGSQVYLFAKGINDRQLYMRWTI